jgi:dCMP deaminase
VGALVVRENRIISHGYNGAPSGMEHCKHRLLDPDRPCKISVHAEVNTIAFAAKHGMSLKGSTLYTTHSPCLPCSQVIINTGIVEVFYGELYRDSEGVFLLEKAGLQTGQIVSPGLHPVSYLTGYNPDMHTGESTQEELPFDSDSRSPWGD